MFGNHVLRLRSRVAVKLNFPPYIRRYTSPNENFEYSYPLIKLPFVFKTFVLSDFDWPLKTGFTVESLYILFFLRSVVEPDIMSDVFKKRNFNALTFVKE